MWLKAYYDLRDKDKAMGKDFNKVAHDKMVQVQFEFDEMRKLQRLQEETQRRRKD